MPVDAPVLVQNETEGPLVFQNEVKPESLAWEAKGHPGGKDMCWVSADTAIGDPNFIAAVNRGLLSILQADEETRERITRSVIAYSQARGAADEAALKVTSSQDAKVVGEATIEVGEHGKVNIAEENMIPVRMDRQRSEPMLNTVPGQAPGVI